MGEVHAWLKHHMYQLERVYIANNYRLCRCSFKAAVVSTHISEQLTSSNLTGGGFMIFFLSGNYW